MVDVRAFAICLATLAGSAGPASAQTPIAWYPTSVSSPATSPPTGVTPPSNISIGTDPALPVVDLRLPEGRPLLGVWRAERDLEDRIARMITRLEFRDDGLLLVEFTTDVQQKNGRSPTRSRHRYRVRGIEGGTYTLEFEYIGGDTEVAAENRRRLARFELTDTQTLRTEDGDVLTRIR